MITLNEIARELNKADKEMEAKIKRAKYLNENWARITKNRFKWLKRVGIIQKRRRKYYQKVKEKVNKYFGHTCIICKRSKGMICKHEKNYKEHPRDLYYIFNHKEDFIILCTRCHQFVHVLYEQFGLTLDGFYELIKSVDK